MDILADAELKGGKHMGKHMGKIILPKKMIGNRQAELQNLGFEFEDCQNPEVYWVRLPPGWHRHHERRNNRREECFLIDGEKNKRYQLYYKTNKMVPFP